MMMMYISVCKRTFIELEWAATDAVYLRSDRDEVRILVLFTPDPHCNMHGSSVRSTNVYEEKSLGVFRDNESYDEDQFEPTGSRMTVWSQYLAMHARKQLAFGTKLCYFLCVF